MPTPAHRTLCNRAWARDLLRAGLAAVVLTGCGPAPEVEIEPDAKPRPTPNLLLLISVDTLRADRLGALGSELGLTPNLDALAAESVSFTAAFAAAPFTLPSVSALMTGRHPEELGIFRNESALPESVPTLASELRQHGWLTRAVVSNFILRRSSGMASGFEHYDDEFPQVEIVRKWPERIAPATTTAAIAQLDDCASSEGAGCFVWVHYQDPHGPYTPPEALLEQELARDAVQPDTDRQLPVSRDHVGIGAIPSYQVLGDRRDIGFYRAGYHAEIRFLDGEIGRLLAALDERGLRDRTLVAFTADHGEGLGERDYWFAHGETLDDGQVHVPLFFRVPGRRPERRDDVASLTDVFPTLLAAVGAAPATTLPDGRDLLAPGAEQAQSRAYFASLGGARKLRHGLIDGDYRLVVTQRDDVWDARLTRRGSDTDLTAAAPQIAKPLRKRLHRIRRRLARGRDEIRQELSQEERRSLEALGYIDESEPQ